MIPLQNSNKRLASTSDRFRRVVKGERAAAAGDVAHINGECAAVKGPRRTAAVVTKSDGRLLCNIGRLMVSEATFMGGEIGLAVSETRLMGGEAALVGEATKLIAGEAA